MHRPFRAALLLLIGLISSVSSGALHGAEPERVAPDDLTSRPPSLLESLLSELGIGRPSLTSAPAPVRATGKQVLHGWQDGGYLVPWTPLTPVARTDFSAAFDPANGCFLLAGGRTERGFPDDVHELGPEGRWRRVASGGWSAPRSAAPMAYDPVQKRMLVFGGFYSQSIDGPPGHHCSSRDDTYELRPGRGWTRLAVIGATPPRRYDHAAVVDPARNRLVVFGGTSLPISATYCWSTVPLNDVWVLSLGAGGAWSQVHPAGVPPPAGIAGSAVYDPASDRLLFVAGSLVWALNFTPSPSWESIPVNGPGPAASAACVLRGSARLLAQDPASTWALDLTSTAPAWTKLVTTGAPVFSSDLRAGWDPDRNRLLVMDGSPEMRVWQLPLSGPAVWTRADRNFPPLAAHRAVYDAVRDRILIAGGIGQQQVLAFDPDDPGGFEVVDTGDHGPGEVLVPMVFHDARRDRLIMFGGVGPTGPPVTWSLQFGEPSGWVAHPAPPISPPASRLMTGVLDERRDRILVFDSSIWELPLGDLSAWKRLESPPGPSPQINPFASATFDPVRDRFVMFGGLASFGYSWDFWFLDLGSFQWTRFAPQAYQVLTTPILTYDGLRDRYVMSAGHGGIAAFVFHPSFSNYWDYLDQHCCGWDTFIHSDRQFHAAVHDPVRDALVVVGGEPLYGGTTLKDVWRLPYGQPGLRARVSVDLGAHTVARSPRGRGVFAATLYGAEDIAAPEIDPASIRLGGASVRTPGEGHARIVDVDGDGFDDLLVHLEAGELQLVQGQRALLLSAQSRNGTPISGAALLAPTGSASLAHLDMSAQPSEPARFELKTVRYAGAHALDLEFSVSEPGPVRVAMFDVAGRRHAVMDMHLAAGAHRTSLRLPGSPAAGVYFVRLTQGAHAAVRRVVIGGF
jgi:hypothetical protein